jgi:hypothetical protein
LPVPTAEFATDAEIATALAVKFKAAIKATFACKRIRE